MESIFQQIRGKHVQFANQLRPIHVSINLSRNTKGLRWYCDLRFVESYQNFPARIRPLPLPIGLVLLFLALLCQCFINQLLLSSLTHILGAKFGATTPFHLVCRYYVDSTVPFIRSLDRKYGPIVRVGPYKEVVNDRRQLGLIYGSRTQNPEARQLPPSLARSTSRLGDTLLRSTP